MLVAVAVGSGPGVKRHGCGRAAEAWLRGCLSSIVQSVLPRRRRRCERQSPNFVVLAPSSSSPPFSVPQEGPRRRILEVVAITLQGAIALPLACAMLWPMVVEAARRPMRWGPGSGGGPARGGSALKSRGGAAGESGLESAAAGLGSTAVAGPCTGRVGEGGGGADSATLAAGPLCERGTAAACEHTRVCAAGRADRPQHGDGTGRPTLPDGWEGRPTGCRRLPRCRGCAPPAPLARPARAADHPRRRRCCAHARARAPSSPSCSPARLSPPLDCRGAGRRGRGERRRCRWGRPCLPSPVLVLGPHARVGGPYTWCCLLPNLRGPPVAVEWCRFCAFCGGCSFLPQSPLCPRARHRGAARASVRCPSRVSRGSGVGDCRHSSCGRCAHGPRSVRGWICLRIDHAE